MCSEDASGTEARGTVWCQIKSSVRHALVTKLRCDLAEGFPACEELHVCCSRSTAALNSGMALRIPACQGLRSKSLSAKPKNLNCRS